jgi:putative transposase
VAIPKKYLAPLIPERFYHVYNYTNNRENIFGKLSAKIFFLQQYQKYLSPFVETYAYNLLDNEVNLIISIKPQQLIIDYLETIPWNSLRLAEKQVINNPVQPIWKSHLVEWEFMRLFTSIAMNANSHKHRKGNLFHRPFKRVPIHKGFQFCPAIAFVHTRGKGDLLSLNTPDFSSSYPLLLSDGAEFLNGRYVFERFGGRRKFREAHTNLSWRIAKYENFIGGQFIPFLNNPKRRNWPEIRTFATAW